MKHKTLRTLLCVILTVCFCMSAIVPASAAGLFGGDWSAASTWDQMMRNLKDWFGGTDTQPDEDMDTPVTDTDTYDTTSGTNSLQYRIVHLDCGRKYFSVENIKKLIDTMAQYGYNQLQLAFGNDGFRFLLDEENMSLTYNDGSNDVTIPGPTLIANIKAGNVAYTGSQDEAEKYLTEADVLAIIAYADEKNIEIVPLINMPGHAKAMMYVMDSGYYTSDYSVNLNSTAAKNYALAILQKYVDWFANTKKVNYFNFGADEYNSYSHDCNTVDPFVAECAKIIANAGMTPRSFNDSLRYNQNRSCGLKETLPNNKTLQVCHWGQGWSGYNTSTASSIKNAGYDLINTNGTWYYVLKAYMYLDNGQYKYNNGSAYYYNESNDYAIELPTKKCANGYPTVDTYAIQGGSESVSGGKGVMFCIWCDKYDAITDTEVISDSEYGALTQIKALAEQYRLTENGGGDTTVVPISVAVGSSLEVKLDGNVAFDNITNNEYVTVTRGKPTTTSETVYKPAEFKTGTFYISNVANDKNPTKQLTFENSNSNNKYYVKYNESYIYLSYQWYSSSWEYKTTKYKSYAEPVIIKQSSNGVINMYSEYTDTWSGNNSSYYITFNGTSFGGSRTASNIYLYDLDTVTGATKTPIIFTGKKVTPDNQPVAVPIENAIYSVTVTPQGLTNVTLPVELWVTNQYIGATSATATETGHFVTLHASENGLYSVDGVDLATLVPDPGYQPSSSKTNTFWKGVVLHDGDKQYHANGSNSDKSDKSGKGDSFYKIRYYEGNWSYLVSGGWKNVESTDTVIAYYLQDFIVSPEIETHTRDWGDAPTSAYTEARNGDWNHMYTATCFSVVYPDYSLSRDENAMYANAMMRGNNGSADYDGLGAGKQSVGVVYAENNSDYKVSKITVVKANKINLDETSSYYSTTYSWPAADGTNNPIEWAKETNDAGQQWYSERIVWSADDPETYGETPMFVGAKFNADGTPDLENSVFFDVDSGSDYYNKAYLILIYLEPVAKADNLNVVYWDDNAQTRINPKDIQIVVSEGTTFVNGLKNVTGAAAGATVTLPDNAYIVNSSGVQQKFNKDITILEGVAAGYKSGLYEYVSADISKDGKTLTLHYKVRNVPNALSYVVDFGLPIKVDGILTWLGLNGDNVSLSVTRGKCEKSRHGTYGTATISNDQDSITYVLDETLDATAAIPIYIFNKEGTALSATDPAIINIIPATNVYYEETFLNIAENSTVWTDTSTARNPYQTLEKSDAQKYVYGYDPAYANATNDTYSMGNAKKATLTLSADAFSTKTSEALTFTFEGDGYDIISECGTDVGLLVAYTYRVENGKETLKYIDIMDNYFCGDDTYITGNDILAAQVPVIRKLNLSDGYGKYKVKIIGYLRQTAGVLNVSDSMAAQSYAAMASVDSPVVYDYESSTNAIVDEILADLGVANLADVDVRVSFVDKNSILNGGTGVFAKETVQDMKNDLRSAYTVQANEGYKAGSAVVYVDAFRVYNPLGHDTTKLPTPYNDAHENSLKYESMYDYLKNSGSAVTNSEAVDNALIYVEYDGNTKVATIKDYKKQGPENEIYLTAGQNKSNYIGIILQDWVEGYTVMVSAKSVLGNPALCVMAQNNKDIRVAEVKTKTELYYDLSSYVKWDSTIRNWVLVLGNQSNAKSVLSISGIKISKDCSAGSSKFFAESVKDSFTSTGTSTYNPDPFSVTSFGTVSSGDEVSLNVKVDGSADFIKLYDSKGSEVKEAAVSWNNQRAYSKKKVTFKSFTVYFDAPEVTEETTLTYKVVAVNADVVESNPIEITITVVA